MEPLRFRWICCAFVMCLTVSSASEELFVSSATQSGTTVGALDATVTDEDVQLAVQEATEMVRERIEVVEPHVLQAGGKLGPESAYFYLYGLTSGSEETRTISAVALISQMATHILAVRHNLTVGHVSLVLPHLDTLDTMLGDTCPTPTPLSSCPPSKYRSLDGTCNNPDQPTWGAARTPFLRLLPAWYADGVSSARLSLSGTPLPPATQVSARAHGGDVHSHAHVSFLAGVWAQLTAHDLARPVVFEGVRGEKLRCCGLSSDVHPECLAIQDGVKCHEFVRSAPGTTTDCSLGVREQLNSATVFLDSSAIYGSSKEENDAIRSFEGGSLQTQADWLLPRSTSHTCQDDNLCFQGADLRLNLHVGIASLQTLLIHEHNRLAAELAELNPQWGDETLFEEARAILIAQMQHITYKEFLPTLLGPQVVEENELLPLASGYSKDYDISIEPGVFNAVATAVLQLTLTLLPEQISRGREMVQLTGTAMNMTEIYKPHAYEQFIQGLLDTSSLTFDPSISGSLRSMWGEVDLVARTIQSGRDHGLPPYVVWRPLCGRKPAKSFEDLHDVMEPNHAVQLKELYADVADIDLFTGVVSERPIDGAVVGPTASCLLSLQFKVLKQTDRYWYENDLPPSSFSKEQLFELRRASMASLICANVPGLKDVPKAAFLAPDHFLNAPVLCSNLDTVDLKAWKMKGKVFLDHDIMVSVVGKGKVAMEKRRLIEKELFESGNFADAKGAVGAAYAHNKPNPTSMMQANTSFLLEATSEELMHLMQDRRVRRQIQGGQGNSLDFNLNNVDVTSMIAQAPLVRNCREAEESSPCDIRTRFRSFSGHCNNLARPDFGRANSVFARMLPAGYDDGVAAPRLRSVTGSGLPSPRFISTAVHNDISHLHQRYTLMLMQFGQFVDHDITFTPVGKGFQNSILDCRDCESRQRVHPECMPIPVPDNDPFFPSININTGRRFCMAFTRSLPGQQSLGNREQINQNTAYLDASHIYGQDLCESLALRSNFNGLLNITQHPIRGKPLMPQESGKGECRAESGRCFVAGDQRASENPGLSILHTLWLRQHNILANGLATVNPHWSDERIYQETRRLLTAEWQTIIYNEYLPRVLGWNAMQLYSLRLKTEGYHDEYDGSCNPGILNEFASAAYRFGHSLIRKSFMGMDASGSGGNREVQLRKSFFNPDMLLEFQMIDDLVRGLITTPMETLDNFLSEEITNHLFEDQRRPFSGFDLAALNIQRARDHGIRPYNEYRAVCNLKKARTFEDLSREIKPELIARLQRVYKSVDDIDLFTGGLCETPLQGGIIGPTFGCIIGLQFSFLRKCDRFWHETSDPTLRFSEPQLAEIRKFTLASLVCDNTDTVDQIQRGAFDIPHAFLNPRVPCSAIPRVNLEPWLDTNTCTINGFTVSVGDSRRTTPCTACSCGTAGPQCQTVKVNCFELRSRFSLDEILRDNVCRAQCGNILDPNRPQPPTGQRPPQAQFSDPNIRPLPTGQRRPPNAAPATGNRPTGNAMRFPFPIPGFLRGLFNNNNNNN